MSHRVVIAEDDAINQLLLERLFTAAGFEVAVAADGPAALALLERGDVDLMLLDVMMPGQSGLEVLTIARAKGFDLPIIMVTALDSPDEVAAALERGADDYVTKPFSPKVLLARVKLRLHATAAPAPPSQLEPGLSPAWDSALARLLAKLPASRPTAAEAAALVRALA